MTMAVADTFHIGPLVVGLLGGLAIFLLGMEQMTATLQLIAGDRMKQVLARLTANRFTSVLAGALVTSVIQSSSVTTVLVVGFVSAGLMTFPQSIGVIMGAGIGTTITAQIIAFKITQAALALVAIGFAIQFAAQRERLRQYGTLLLGLGLLFFGMNVMSDATLPLRDSQSFVRLVGSLDNAALGIVLSAGFTAVVQSSSATTVLIIVLAGQSLITLEQAIPLVFGANIGTCVTAMLAAIGKPRAAIRAATVHVVFNVMGVLLWFGWIDSLAWGVRQLTSDPQRQIAHSHAIFNIANTCVLIWFVTPLARLTTMLIPDRDEEAAAGRPRFLDDILLQTPALAMDAVRMELGRLGVAALRMARGGLTAALRGDGDLQRLEKLDDDVDSLHAAIVTYLGRLSRENLSDRQATQLHERLLAANYFENIGDLIESNLVGAGRRRIRDELTVSRATEDVMQALHQEVCWSIERSVRALVEDDDAIALEVLDAKEQINRLIAACEVHLSRRLSATAPKRLEAFRLESEILESLKRMYYFAKRIAKLVRQDEGEPVADGTETDSPQRPD